MANEKKMTKKEMYAQIMANYNLTEDEIAFINHEIELLSRKNASGEKKPTATQLANDNLKAQIYDAMEVGKLYTITDLIKSIPALADLSNQKVSALVRGMTSDLVERVEDKRKAYFRKVVM